MLNSGVYFSLLRKLSFLKCDIICHFSLIYTTSITNCNTLSHLAQNILFCIYSFCVKAKLKEINEFEKILKIVKLENFLECSLIYSLVQKTEVEVFPVNFFGHRKPLCIWILERYLHRQLAGPEKQTKFYL